MRTKQFLFACGGLLLLVIAYAIGASTAQSQVVTNRVVGITHGDLGGRSSILAVTENGDWYWQFTNSSLWPNPTQPPWEFGGNIFGTVVNIEGTNWSDVKKHYREGK